MRQRLFPRSACLIVATLACGLPAAARQCEVAQLDVTALPQAGSAVALAGDLAVVGAAGGEHPTEILGLAAVYRLGAGGYEFEQLLQASDGIVGDRFGWSLALSGERILVGAPYRDSGGIDESGAVYVFELQGGVWLETAILSASTPLAGREFGWDVDLDGDRALIGACSHLGLTNGFNAAFVFEVANGTWSATDTLNEPSTGGLNQFGYSVALSGDTVLVGAPGDQEVGTDAGAAFVYRHGPGGFTFEAKLVVPGNDACAGLDGCSALGTDLDLDGEYAVVVGNHISNQDDLHVFERSGSTWNLAASFPPGITDFPRHDVAISGDRVALLWRGPEHRFRFYERGPAGWVVSPALTLEEPAAFCMRSIAIDGHALLGGCPQLGGSDGAAILYQVAPEAVRRCTSVPNSTGSAAKIAANGCASASAGELRLRATPVPNQPGIFFLGTLAIELPFGDGFRCAGGDVVRLAPTLAQGGVLEQEVAPASLGLVAGDVRQVQGWFRDPAAGGAGFNLTDALELTVGL